MRKWRRWNFASPIFFGLCAAACSASTPSAQLEEPAGKSTLAELREEIWRTLVRVEGRQTADSVAYARAYDAEEIAEDFIGSFSPSPAGADAEPRAQAEDLDEAAGPEEEEYDEEGAIEPVCEALRGVLYDYLYLGIDARKAEAGMPKEFAPQLFADGSSLRRIHGPALRTPKRGCKAALIYRPTPFPSEFAYARDNVDDLSLRVIGRVRFLELVRAALCGEEEGDASFLEED